MIVGLEWLWTYLFRPLRCVCGWLDISGLMDAWKRVPSVMNHIELLHLRPHGLAPASSSSLTALWDGRGPSRTDGVLICMADMFGVGDWKDKKNRRVIDSAEGPENVKPQILEGCLKHHYTPLSFQSD